MDSANVDIILVEEYQTKLDGVRHLVMFLDVALWIGGGDHKRGMRFFFHTGLQKVKCEGNKLKMISSFNIDVIDLGLTLSYDILLAVEGSTVHLRKL